MKAILVLLSSFIFLSAQNISFRDLTKLVSEDVHRNIFLDKSIDNYSLDIFIPEVMKRGEIYEMYKNVLFEHNLKLQFNKRGKFYFVSKLPAEDIPREEIPSYQKIHYHSYKIKNITNEDVVAVMKIFPTVKFTYLKQSDIIAYSATDEVHTEVHRLLKTADNKVLSKTLKITIFTVNKNKALAYGSEIRALGYDFNYNVDNFLTSLVSSGSRVHSIKDKASLAFTLYAMENYGIAKIQQSPTLLVTNGKPTLVNSVLNIPYKTSTVTTSKGDTTTRDQVLYRDIGLVVKIDPKIKGNSVFINLELVSEELLNHDNNMPITQKITYQNFVTIKKGKPILLTGIKKVSQSLEKGGVPILSDIPIIGELFKNRENKSSELNINIMIELVDNHTKIYTRADFNGKLVSKPKSKTKRVSKRSKAMQFISGRDY